MKMTLSCADDLGFLVGPQSTQDAKLPLHQAVSHRSVDAVKPLLKRTGATLDILDENDSARLYLAVHSRRLDLVDLLLRHPRANVNCKG